MVVVVSWGNESDDRLKLKLGEGDRLEGSLEHNDEGGNVGEDTVTRQVEGAEEAFGSCSLDKCEEDVEEDIEWTEARGVDTLIGWLDSFVESRDEGVVSGDP